MDYTPALLAQQARYKQSLLCVGLDPEPQRLPIHLRHAADPWWEFNRAIIDATLPYAIAYKPNLAFYEAMGEAGLRLLARTVDYIAGRALVIGDAKRGDIGNTAQKYAEALFTQLGFHAVTLHPYMGADTLEPFLAFPGKWVFVLALTSNPGAAHFELLPQHDGRYLFQHVIERSLQVAALHPAHIGFVAGATHPGLLHTVRQAAGNSWLLVPGIGAQGGDLEAVLANAGMRQTGNVLINAARSVLYASAGEDFAQAATAEAQRLAASCTPLLAPHG
jgi:orotidine-5'-phosphate decarboxylase